MNENDVERAVVLVLSSVLKVSATRSSSRAEHHEWDSLKHIEVVFALEDEFGIQFDEESLKQLTSVPDIVKQVEMLLHAA